MSLVDAHERDSVTRRIARLRDSIYRLALEEIPEGMRTDRLRKLVSELHQLEDLLRATPAVSPETSAPPNGAPSILQRES